MLLRLALLPALLAAASTVAVESRAGGSYCENDGILVHVGEFECDVCQNDGTAIWVGDTCWGDSPAGICLRQKCLPCDGCLALTGLAFDCGLATNPACWAGTFGCTLAGPAVEKTLRNFALEAECQGWPPGA